MASSINKNGLLSIVLLLALVTLLTYILTPVEAQTTLCTGVTCRNGGVVNMATCTCDCPKSCGAGTQMDDCSCNCEGLERTCSPGVLNWRDCSCGRAPTCPDGVCQNQVIEQALIKLKLQTGELKRQEARLAVRLPPRIRR
jgi:hypothetical protein